MHIQYDGSLRDPIDSKFHNYSTSTNLFFPEDTVPTQPKHSSLTPDPPAGNASAALDALPLTSEILQIAHRFERIQQILLHHSEHESIIHEKTSGLKEMAIDWQQLCPDLTNKISIVQDLRHLVGVAEQQPLSPDIRELLDSKFQEYYLQRHYGGLKCDIDDLSIQERGDDSPLPNDALLAVPAPFDYEQMGFGYAQSSGCGQSSGCRQQGESHSAQGQLHYLPSMQRSEESLQYINLKEEKQAGLNKIGGLASLVNESKVAHTEDCCQTNQQHCCVLVQVPRIIEVEIPLVIYRVKQKVITYDQSDLEAPYKDIDQIIDKYSKPYQELYTDQNKQTKHQLSQLPSHPCPSLQIASIMLNSHLNPSKESTEVDLTYSQLPEEQLLLDSCAQIDSLISHSEQPKDEQHLQAPSHILITEKMNSQSILEKFQESERALNEENMELKEALERLKAQLEESERARKEAAVMSGKLAARLEEEIEQGLYLSRKLDELDAQLLEEKVECLTRLADCKDRKIDTLTTEIANKEASIHSLQAQLTEAKAQAEKKEEALAKKEEEVNTLAKHLQERQQDICELSMSENNMITIVSEAELSLRAEIERLEYEKTHMSQQLAELQRRVESEGFSLQYEEAKEIQGIIESRQHIFSLEMKEVRQKYQYIIKGYQQELDEARKEMLLSNHELLVGKNQLHACQQELVAHKQEMEGVMQELMEAKQEAIVLNELNQANNNTPKNSRLSEEFLAQFQAMIKEYDDELEAKDAEILYLKQYIDQIEVFSNEEQARNLKNMVAIIDNLNSEMEAERQEKTKITERLLQMDHMLAVQSSKSIEHQSEMDKYDALIEELTLKMEHLLKENSILKDKVSASSLHSSRAEAGQDATVLRKEIQKLRKVNSRLKKYTLEMENELITISGMNRCESHKQLMAGLAEERNYYVSLLAGSS